MDNIRNIRINKNLYFVLPNERTMNIIQENRATAVIIFLYYEESLKYYLSYIDNIPLFIDIYIVSSNKKLSLEILKYIEKKKNRIMFMDSKNRGRDISALLVACKDIVLNYEYICFIHDKKRKDYYPKEDFELWIENLWGNMLGSKGYILNIMNILDMNKKIGLLVPPEPIGIRMSPWYGNAWGQNWKNTCVLAKQLKLKCDMDYEKSPITFGNAFWARSIALRKLFDKDWKYEDFEEEPLKNDGTISHAIERILGYVAQDAGFETGTVLNTSYAEKLICITQEYLSGAFRLLKESYGIFHLGKFLKNKDSLYEFCKENPRFYLYGAGKIGKKCLQLLRLEGYDPEGYIVSDKSKCNSIVENLPVKMIEDIDDLDKIGIIITVGVKNMEAIENNLHQKGIKKYIKYIEWLE